MLNNKIVNIQERRSEKPLYDMISLILEELKERSINTSKSYEGYYREFFKLTLNKEMEFVTWEDILKINYESVLKYRNSLKKNNINKTINIKIASLNTLYKELHKADRRIDLITVDLNKLPEDEDDSSSYGSLTHEEVMALLEYCDSLPNKQKPLIKKLFFETAYITAIRQGALLKLTWNNIKRITDKKTGVRVWVIRIKDKGKTDDTPITDEFYSRLYELKKTADTNRVFNVTIKTLAKTLEDFCGYYGIEKERNIVIHSLKKASIDKVYHETRDLNKTARHGHHTGVEMVYRNYEGRNETLIDKPSYSVFNNDTNALELEEYTKEQLIEAIGKCGQSFINEILSKLK